MIPRKFVESNLKKAEGCRFFGVPIEDLSRDELIACAVAGWEGQEEQRKQHRHSLDFIRTLKGIEHH